MQIQNIFYCVKYTDFEYSINAWVFHKNFGSTIFLFRTLTSYNSQLKIQNMYLI